MITDATLYQNNTQGVEMITHLCDPIGLTTKQYLEQGNSLGLDETLRDFSYMMRPYTDKTSYHFFEVVGDSFNAGGSDFFMKKDIITAKRVNLSLWRSSDLLPGMDYVIIHSRGISIGQIQESDKRTGTFGIHMLNPLCPDFKINIDSISELYYVIGIADRCMQRKGQNKSKLKI